MNKSDIAKFMQLYMEIQQMPPTVPFHWRVWEVKDDRTPIKMVHLLFSM